MGLISRKLLKRRPQELGKIKIGGLGPERTSSSGKKFRPPQKYDHFVVTTRHRGADGNLVRDQDIHGHPDVGPRPLELSGVLMYETPQENFHAEMLQYRGKTKVFSCDGEVGTDLQTGAEGACPRLAGGDCDCKPYGRLHLQLWASPNTLGFHVLRTTSWESVNNIQTALQEIYERFGTLYQAPVRLVLYPSEDRYTEGGQEKVSTSHKVGLVLAMGMEEAANRMVHAKRHLELARSELRMISGEVQQDLRSRDAEEMEEIAAEFFPEEGVEASVATQAALDDLKGELGVGAPPEPIDADFEVEEPGPNDEIEVLDELLQEARALGVIQMAGEAAVAKAKDSGDRTEIRKWIDALNGRIEKETALREQQGAGS